MKKLSIIITLQALIFSYHPATAQVIHVPADQPTIQAGINAAVNGDTVLVADGVYMENINYLGKAILLASHFIQDGDTSHINNTIINGSQPANPDYGATVTLNSGEDTTSVLCGFTMTGGTGLLLQGIGMRIGGGIACYYAGIKILNNKITGNGIIFNAYAGGGGIGCLGENEGDWLVARYNKISGNTCQASEVVAFGAGVYAECNFILEHNEIFENSCFGPDDNQANGGGVLISASSFPVYFAVRNNFIHDNHCEGYVVNGAGIAIIGGGEGAITGNEIRNNTGTAIDLGTGGGMILNSLSGITDISGNTFTENRLEGNLLQGGGIELVYATAMVNISDNSFEENNLISTVSAYGAGLDFIDCHDVIVANNHFKGNYMQGNDFTVGGGICGGATFSQTAIRNNTFSENWDSTQNLGVGGGIAIFDYVDAKLEIDGNIFEHNNFGTDGGGLYTHNCYNVLVSNNIFSDNSVVNRGGAIRFKYYPGIDDGSFPGNIRRIRNYKPDSDPMRTTFHPLLINNTFLNNSAAQGGAFFCDHQSEFPLVINSIFYENEGTIGDNIYYTGEDSMLVSHCDINTSYSTHIYGNWKGTNNFSEEPGIDDSYHIKPNSPCINTGTDSLEFMGSRYYAPDHDFEGSIRPFGPGIDIGADEYYYYEGIDDVEITNHLIANIYIYPNPFTISAKIEFQLSQSADLEIIILNLLGEQVEVMAPRHYPQGKQECTWNASRLPDGVYFIRIKSGKAMETCKVVKIS